MFVGSVPREVVTQCLGVTDIHAGDKVFVCCSGSFRVDLAIKATHPGARVISNDVSLLSCAIGGLLTGKPLSFKFVKDLDPIEQALAGRGYADRIAGFLVALDCLKYNAKTLYGRRHRDHYLNNARPLIEQAQEKLTKRFGGCVVDGFWAGDSLLGGMSAGCGA